MTDTSDQERVDELAVADATNGWPAMRLHNVTRHFGRGAKRRVVLRDVTFAAEPGTLVHIGGKNGAGKTTLLRVMAGILMPNEGEVLIGALSAERGWREFHRRIGFLSAGDRGLYARLTVRAHLEYWCALAFVARDQRGAHIEHALGAFGLVDLADRRSERLSQGQRQRVRLALALVHRPQVVLLDEPRNSLDRDGLDLLACEVRAAVETGSSVIWCSPPGETQPVDFDRHMLLENQDVKPL